nr:retrovirus-related Pol polyprotein from transposon TNT 1-94 [Tanacetum cinerariifolium]
MLLAQSQEARVVLNEGKHDFLADSFYSKCNLHGKFAPFGSLNDDTVKPRYDSGILSEMLLAQSQEARVALNEGKHDFLADNCDDKAIANAIFMENLSPFGSLNDDTVKPHYDSGILSELAKQGLIKGLPKLKYTKDHLCLACQMGKSKMESHPHKPGPTINEKLQMLHMDLCGPMLFLRTKDEASDIIIKILKQAQVRLNATLIYLHTDTGIEFLNQTLQNYTEEVGITHNASNARTPQQNGVVERRNRTLIEAARTMVIFSKSQLFICAEAVATACHTQNRFLIHTRYNKTPYELLRDRKPELKYLHVFGIFINQAKYALEMLKKYGFKKCDVVDIPMVGQSKLDEDLNGTPVNPTRYRGMVGSLMYLTASHPDLVLCMCARYQAKPTEKHLTTVKRIFRYLKGTINMGIFINQAKYALEMLKKYGFKKCDVVDIPMVGQSKLDEDLNGTPVNPTRYRGMVGSLMYLTASHPDLVLCMCARYQAKPTEKHLTVFRLKKAFYGLKQAPRACPIGIFINQAKYALEMLKKYGFEKCDVVDIPMVGQSKLDEDLNETPVNPTRYRGMVGSLMYLTASRPDLVFVLCMCARYQAKPTEKHLTTVKRIFRYLKGTINMVENEVVELYFVQTDYQLSDIFTKALARERFEFLINHLDMQSITPEQLKRLAESDEE